MFRTRNIVALTVLIITISVAAYVIVVVIPASLARKTYEGARQIGEDIRKAFQFTPEVTVNNTIVLQQEVSILELATLSQTFRHEYEWINSWMGSTKKITIKGTFDAKAGFDLQKKFNISVSDEKIVVTLPAPKILSVEPKGDLTFTDENGIWNWVDAEDRAKAVNAFTIDARKLAQKNILLKQTESKMEEQLRNILLTYGKEVEIRYEDIPNSKIKIQD
jgi:hypothetical protein